jgi:charged multivesicular body protein 1
MSQAAMEKNLFNLKFAAKELERNSKKCDKVNQ